MIRSLLMRAAALALGAALLAPPAGAQDRAAEREALVETIQRHPEADGIGSEVLDAIRTVPRHLFVPEAERAAAYQDRPLPIGYGQTISQPFIVALMTDLLELEPSDRVLEVGTGSGYQAAVLSPLVEEVRSIEIVPELGRRAAGTLADEGFANVETRIGDGYYGWPEGAPYDAIVVTAAAGAIPPPLVEQLAPGGRMVIPVGGPFSAQTLMLVEKREDGGIATRQILPVRFVPFTRAEGG